MEFLKQWQLILVVSFGMAVALSWSWLPNWATAERLEKWSKGGPIARWLARTRFEQAYRVAMAVCAALGVWAFTLFGQMHDHGVFGHQNFHAHDCYHYYFGSKYLKEWGYDGMYLATVTALEEIGHDEPRKAIHFDRIRDLRGSARFLRRDEFLPLVPAVRARFTPERWTELKRDLSFLREKTSDNKWWNGVVLDSGFNPPPSYAVMSSALSNRIPFTESTWKWLGYLDFALLGTGIVIMAFAIGPVAALFTPVIMGNAPITTYNWTGGSFLRQLWVFFLMLGLSLLARRKWYAAGVALGACVAAVFFPIFFLFGALVPLGYLFLRNRKHVAVFRVAIPAAITVAVLVALSVARFGTQPWVEWHDRISAHADSFFDNHIGLKKVTTYAPEIAPQAFGAGDNVYPAWDHALVARSHRGGLVDVALALLLSALAILGGLRLRPAEACIVVGSGLVVFWTMPAGYYTIYVGVFAAFMLANRRTEPARLRFSIVCLALFLALLLQKYEGERILQTVSLSVGWILCICILSAMNWIERPGFRVTLRQRKQVVGAFAAGLAALLVVVVLLRDLGHPASFLPTQVVRGGHVADVLDVGPANEERAHGMDIGEALRVPRSYMDVYGYRVQDECGILRKGRTLRYDLAPMTGSGRLVVRSDSFYKGQLLTTINGTPMAPVELDPLQTMFGYLVVPLPPGLGPGPLHVEQQTTAQDVGIFTVWLVQD